MSKKLLLAIFAWLALCCAVSAQGVPNGGRSAVPNAAAPPQLFSGYVVGNWYIGAQTGNFVAGTAPGSGTIQLYPAVIQQAVTINALGVRIGTLFASGNVQAAIYANNPATGRPTGPALVSTASMSTTSVGSVNAAASLSLQPGVYWFATNSDNATVAFTAIHTNSAFLSWNLGSASQGNDMSSGTGLSGLSVTQAFGTWPNLTAAAFTEVGGSAAFPLVQFKVASVP